MTEYEKQIVEDLLRAVDIFTDEANAAGLVYTASGIKDAVERTRALIDEDKER